MTTSSLRFPVQPDAPKPVEHPEYRRSVIESGVNGTVRFVYRDEHGYILLDWPCDPRISDDSRRIAMRAQQLIGDTLPAFAARRSPPLLVPRIVP